jgi:epoxide hydrolase-like predicted phosphatase
MSNPITAVVFDLGGVVLGSPLAGIAEYENQNNIPLGFVNVNIVSKGDHGAFQRLERGEIPMNEFYESFQQELEDPQQIERFSEFTRVPRAKLPRKIKFDTKKLFGMMLEKSMEADPEFVHCIYMLRGLGLKVGALTNNFAPMGSSAPGAININALVDLFHGVVESAVEGVRKPDPKAFLMICDRLKANPTQAVMLDDLGMNLKGAKLVGMETVLVKLKNKRDALQRLQDLIAQRNPSMNPQLLITAPQPQKLFWNIADDTEPVVKNIVGDAFGIASNPPVILLHGGGQSRHAWGGTCQTLANNGFFAIAIDMKGHGESYWDEKADYRSSAYAVDLDKLVNKIGIASRAPLFIAASLGGLATLEARFCQTPLCGGIVLVDVTPRLEHAGVERVLTFMSDGMKNGFDTLEEAAKAIQAYQPQRNRPINPDGLKKNLRFDERRQKYVFHWDPAFLGNHIKDGKVLLDFEQKLLQEAKKITCPVLLLRGKLTDLVSEEGVDSLRTVIKHAEVVNVVNAGHMVAGDQNDIFSSESLKFALRLKPKMQESSLALIGETKLNAKL